MLVVSLWQVSPVLQAGQIVAPERQWRALMATKSLKCTFPWAGFVEWKADEPKLSYGPQRLFEFHIDGIDHAKGAARIVGNAGSDDLVALDGKSSVSFVETTPAGAINLTTVYAWADKAGRYKAVHSRHTAVGGPSPSQNYGFCEMWE